MESSLAELYSGEAGTAFPAISMENFSRRAFSLILFLKAETGGEPLRLVVKKPLPHEAIKAIVEGDNQAVVEFGILSDLSAKFASVEGCGVPRPVLVLPEEETLVLEHVRGVDLDYAARGARIWSDEQTFLVVRQVYRNCGKWLGHFQSFTGVSREGAGVLDSLGAKLDFKLDCLMSRRHPKVPADLGKKILSAFKKAHRKVEESGASIPVSGRHGDFGGWNILVDGTRVTVIDFLGYSRDLASLDFVKMLITLSEKRIRLVYSKNRIDTLLGDFVEGYGAGPETPVEVYYLCELYYRTAAALGCVEQLHKRIDRKIDRARILKDHLAWLENASLNRFTWENRLNPASLQPGSNPRQN